MELQAKQIDHSSLTSSHHQSSLVLPCVVVIIIIEIVIIATISQWGVSVPFHRSSVLVVPGKHISS